MKAISLICDILTSAIPPLLLFHFDFKQGIAFLIAATTITVVASSKILSRVRVTIDGVWIGNWIY
jgi:hypothetical protein